MTGKRDAVRILPWVFALVLVVGAAPIAAVMTWITDLRLFQASFFITGTVVVLSLSMVGHIWLFCRLSGRPIGDVRRPTLILHGAIILPAPFLFLAVVIMGFAGYVGLDGETHLLWGGGRPDPDYPGGAAAGVAAIFLDIRRPVPRKTAWRGGFQRRVRVDAQLCALRGGS